MRYKVILMLTGKLYEKYVNAVKFEELRGNIEVVAVVDVAPYAGRIDGWRMCTAEEAFAYDFDYIICSMGIRETGESARTFAACGIDLDRVLPIGIFSVPCFDFKEYAKLHHSRVSIIAKNCWGGFTYHSLFMKFTSPFINMFLSDEGYMKVLGNLEYYMSLPLAEDDSEAAKGKAYPCALLGDVNIDLNHYKSFDEAKKCWDERVCRINWDNLFVMTYTADINVAQEFDSLPYGKKVIFTSEDFGVPGQICLEKFRGSVADMKSDMWRIVNSVANGTLQLYDPIKLLNGDGDFYRTEG